MITARYRSLNFGDATCASSRYRILAYIEGLQARGIEIIPGPADALSPTEDLSQFDGVIIQKKLFSTRKVRRIRAGARRLIYDIDDAIWLPQGRRHHWWTRLRTDWRLRSVVSRADACVVANQVIAARLVPWARRLEVQPMVLDAAMWSPAPLSSEASRDIVLGWSGAPGNLRYLEPLEPALAAIQERHPSLRVVVLCGEKPKWSRLRFDHVAWRPGIEAETVSRFSIGLLPLETSAFAGGKSPIKGLQYMASGIPTVATPLAATRELFGASEGAMFAESIEEWQNALGRLIQHPEERASRGAAARLFFLERHTLARGLDFWAQLLAPQ